MTFSIVARSADGESWGVAVASKFLAVGSAVPAAVAGVGAIATQADANVAYKGQALAHLDDGATAEVALQRLLEDDEGRDHRQVGIVDVDGNAASHTGTACLDWAGSRTGPGYAIQGNILTGSEVVDAVEASWLASPEGAPLAHRLLEALAAGDEAGGDSRGRQSAALLVVRDGAGYGGLDDIAVDLRVDDHAMPITELTRLLEAVWATRAVPAPAPAATAEFLATCAVAPDRALFRQLVEAAAGTAGAAELDRSGVASAHGLTVRDRPARPALGASASKLHLPRPFDRSILERLFALPGNVERRALIERE